MWMVEALIARCELSLPQSEHAILRTTMIALFQQPYYKKFPLETGAKLYFLNYIQRIFDILDSKPKELTLNDIIEIVQGALIIAEKVYHEEAVFCSDFVDSSGKTTLFSNVCLSR